MRQEDGVVFIEDLDGTFVTKIEDVGMLLQIVLTAIRVHGTEEEKDIAAKIAMSNLGVARFQR